MLCGFGVKPVHGSSNLQKLSRKMCETGYNKISDGFHLNAFRKQPLLPVFSETSYDGSYIIFIYIGVGITYRTGISATL